MDEFRFDTLEQIKHTVNNFHKVPKVSRAVIANGVNRKLRELNEFVEVVKENTILEFPSDRFIVLHESTETNEFNKFKYLLESDIESFNENILESLQKETSNIVSNYELVNKCKEINNKANEVYLSVYPTHNDLINIFECATNLITSHFLFNNNEEILESAMDDIEFIIARNVLTESHVKRLLSPVMILKERPMFKRTFTSSRLDKLFESDIELPKAYFDEFALRRPYRNGAIESYLKIQKIGYEEQLVNSYYNGDYSITNNDFIGNIQEAVSLDNIIKNNHKLLQNINYIDKFILEKHGVFPITSRVYEGKEYFLHSKNNKQYTIYKNPNIKDSYFMITESKGDKEYKAFKFTIKNNKYMSKESMDTMIESAFITEYKR